ncbi:MAG: hypothetical protein ACYCS8_03965 [Acidithiobacillus sp.]
MSEFKVGDKVRLEGVVHSKDSGGDGVMLRLKGGAYQRLRYRALINATLIEPEPEHDTESHTHITPCKGMNCGSTTGMNHSPECQAEHIAAITGVPVEDKVLDLSKPMRTKNNKVPVSYLTTDRLGLLWVQEIDTKIVLGMYAKDLENIPEPKRTYKLEVGMVPFTTGLELRTDFRDFNGVKCRARITHTEGEGWSIEEIK